MVTKRWWLLGTLQAPLCSLALVMQPVERRQGSADEFERTASMIDLIVILLDEKSFLLVQLIFSFIILTLLQSDNTRHIIIHMDKEGCKNHKNTQQYIKVDMI